VGRAAKPHDALIAAIREAGRPIGGRDLHRAIREAGQPESTWQAWASGLKDWIVLHPRVRVTGSGAAKRYRWGKPVSARTALTRLARRVKAPQWLRDAWHEVVAAGLHHRPAVNPRLRAAQEMQARIGIARAAAELAIEVEEIIHNGADGGQVVKRVRNALAGKDLTPIGAAGEDTVFDPARHRVEAGDPRPGAPVFILRPGYLWRYGSETMIIEHALVAKA
jgi:hypothetical protein